jgi:ribosomal protein S1
MADLLAASGFRGYERGDKVEGTITSISGREVLIDIGGKMDGVVGEKEWEDVKAFVATLKPGDKVLTHVISPENEKGQMILSIRNAMQSSRWQVFDELLKSREVISVKPLEINKGGLLADYSGIRGFLPSSQLTAPGNLNAYLNRSLDVIVIEVDKKQNRLVFSEKAITAGAEKEARLIKIRNIKFGNKYEGKITGVANYGLQVVIDGEVEGFVHVSEVAWGKTTDLFSKYKIDDPIEVVAVSVNDADGKINFSIKQLTEDPFAAASQKYRPDDKVKAKVAHISGLGVYLGLEEGVEGLIPAAKLANQNYAVGQEVSAVVEEIDSKRRQILLTPVLTKKFVGYK